MPATKPIQARAKRTESEFLEAFEKLLARHGLAGTTIDEVADLSGKTRSAFLRRFGNKQGALEALFETYCHAARSTMRDVVLELKHAPDVHSVLFSTSQRYEDLLRVHKASNRAMHELFMQNLEVHDLTKAIFRECVDMMKHIQDKFMEQGKYSDKGAWAAAQLLVTVDYNFVLEAMPAFPSDSAERHDLVADLLEAALRR